MPGQQGINLTLPPRSMDHYDGSSLRIPEYKEKHDALLRAQGKKPVDPNYEALAENAKKYSRLSNDVTQMDFQDWLKLTIASFKNQDPMNPQDPSNVAAQLANIGMALGFNNLRDEVTKIISMMTKGMSLNASDKTGQQIEAEFDKFKFDGTKEVDLGYDLPTAAKRVQISIFDDKFKLVHREIIEDDPSKNVFLKIGRNQFKWNGKLNNGQQAEKGVYQFQVRAYNAEDEAIKDSETGKILNIRKYIQGTLEACYVSNDKPMVVVDGIDMPFDAIKKVMGQSKTMDVNTPATNSPANPLVMPQANAANISRERDQELLNQANQRRLIRDMNSVIDRYNLG